MGANRWVVGVDPSSRKLAGVAAPVDGDDEVFALWVVVLPSARPIEERCLKAYATARSFAKRLMRADPTREVYVFIEAPLVGRGGVSTTVKQSKVHGATVAGFLAGGAVHVREESVSRVKKAVVGAGNATKEEIATWCEVWKPAISEAVEGDQDLTDAAMHLQYGISTIKKMKG